MISQHCVVVHVCVASRGGVVCCNGCLFGDVPGMPLKHVLAGNCMCTLLLLPPPAGPPLWALGAAQVHTFRVGKVLPSSLSHIAVLPCRVAAARSVERVLIEAASQGGCMRGVRIERLRLLCSRLQQVAAPVAPRHLHRAAPCSAVLLWPVTVVQLQCCATCLCCMYK
jgi:hypothetical protein